MEQIYVGVYGTLKKDEVNHHYLDEAEYVGTGIVTGKLYETSWYPLLDDKGSGNVYVEIYKVDEKTLAQLDKLEEIDPNCDGNEYQRILTSVLPVESPRSWLPSHVWVYTLNKPAAHLLAYDGENWTSQPKADLAFMTRWFNFYSANTPASWVF